MFGVGHRLYPQCHEVATCSGCQVQPSNTGTPLTINFPPQRVFLLQKPGAEFVPLLFVDGAIAAPNYAKSRPIADQNDGQPRSLHPNDALCSGRLSAWMMVSSASTNTKPLPANSSVGA